MQRHRKNIRIADSNKVSLKLILALRRDLVGKLVKTQKTPRDWKDIKRLIPVLKAAGIRLIAEIK